MVAVCPASLNSHKTPSHFVDFPYLARLAGAEKITSLNSGVSTLNFYTQHLSCAGVAVL